jgi:hypothetical protein
VGVSEFRARLCRLSILHDEFMRLCAAQQGFCFAHGSDPLMTRLIFKLVQLYFSSSGAAKVFSNSVVRVSHCSSDKHNFCDMDCC